MSEDDIACVRIRFKVGGEWQPFFEEFIPNNMVPSFWAQLKTDAQASRQPVHMVVPRSDVEWEYHPR